MAGNRYAKFGITLKGYQDLFDAQGGVCAACKSPPDKKRLAVDHDHATGRVRGLLCSHCNLALGLTKDNPDILEGLRLYLGASPGSKVEIEQSVHRELSTTERRQFKQLDAFLERFREIPGSIASLSYDPSTGAVAASFHKPAAEQPESESEAVKDEDKPPDFRFALETFNDSPKPRQRQ